MIELTLEGSYYDIGVLLGKQYKVYFSDYFSEKYSKEQIDFAYECLNEVRQFFPEIMQEIDGIVDGGNIDYENLLVSDISARFQKNCTIFAVPSNFTHDDTMFFARSLDWFQDTIPYNFIFKTYPNKKIPSLGFCDTIIGRLGGFNKAGVVISESNCIWGNFQPGLVSHLIIRWILDNCKTAQEAVNFLERIPHVIGNNYLVADKNNTIARIEACQVMKVTTYFKDEFVAIANHYFSSDFDEITPRKPKHSTDRIDYLNEYMLKNKGIINLQKVQELQRTHEVELCPHVQEKYDDQILPLTTCWAWIHEIGSSKIFLCDTSPCQGKYKEYILS